MEEKIEIKGKTKREVNMELLRIVGMLMVITLHCLGNGLLLGNSTISVYNTVLIRFLDFFSLTANAIFLIISGYYSINKKFNLKKVLNLWGKTIFYSILIYLICRVLNLNMQIIDNASFVSFFPVISGEYWFINAYYANSWLMIPYILLMIITVFIVCLFIDLIMRGLYFGIKKIPIVNKIVKKSNDKLDKINLRLNNYITD